MDNLKHLIQIIIKKRINQKHFLQRPYWTVRKILQTRVLYLTFLGIKFHFFQRLFFCWFGKCNSLEPLLSKTVLMLQKKIPKKKNKHFLNKKAIFGKSGWILNKIIKRPPQKMWWILPLSSQYLINMVFNLYFYGWVLNMFKNWVF